MKYSRWDKDTKVWIESEDKDCQHPVTFFSKVGIGLCKCPLCEAVISEIDLISSSETKQLQKIIN